MGAAGGHERSEAAIEREKLGSPNAVRSAAVSLPRAKSAERTKVLRDAALSLGFSNLILSHNVSALLASANLYILRDSQPDLLIGWLIVLAAFTAITYAVLRFGRRAHALGWPVQGAVGLLSLCAAVNFGRSIGLGGKPLILAVGCVVAVLAVCLWRWRDISKLGALMARVYRFSAVYAVLCIGSACVAIAKPYYPPSFDLANVPDHRAPIVWVVFDELDQGWLFDHRPAGIQLPEFDALRRGSVSFSNAVRPGPETMLSLPALLGGRSVMNAYPLTASKLYVHYAGSKPTTWLGADTVFQGMKRFGRDSSIVGFYHNYGAVFRGYASHIHTEGLVAHSILGSVEYQLLMLIPGDLRTSAEEAIGPSDLWNRASVDEGKIRLERQLADTRHAIEDWRTGFVFLHICLPHAPWISGRFDLTHEGYLDNMKLTDEFLRQIRLSLQRRGVWNDATLLVTADHNFRQVLFGRALNKKVPLLIKLPGESAGLACASKVRAVDERWLIEGVAAGAIKSPAQAVSFMERRAAMPAQDGVPTGHGQRSSSVSAESTSLPR